LEGVNYWRVSTIGGCQPRPLVSTPAHSKLIFWYPSKTQILFEIMVQIKQKRGIGVENPSERSFVGGYIGGYIGGCIYICLYIPTIELIR